MSDAEIALLVDRWNDGELAEPERAALFARLERDTAFALAFTDEVRFRGLLGGLLGARADDRLWQRVDAVVRATTDTGRHRFADRVEARVASQQRTSSAGDRARPVSGRARRASGRARRPRTRGGWWTMALAVAAGLIVALALAMREPTAMSAAPVPAPLPVAVAPTPPPTPAAPALARIQACLGATLDGAPLSGGMDVRASQRLVSDDRGSATLLYEDGTRIELGSSSELSLGDAAGAKRLRLERGTLSAIVAKQPAGRAMSLVTPLSLATVVGTRFTLGCDAAGSELTVTEGRVAFAPVGGGEAVEVAAGESAQVARGAVAKRSPPGPEHARLLAALPLIAPRADERAWAAIPWMTDLWAARRRAAETRKPLLIWAAWGNPLGMSAIEGREMREQWWRDPEVARLAGAFVPVAVDTWYLTRRQDDVGRFFAALAAQVNDHSTTHDGVYCCDAGGTLLGACQSEHPVAELREQLAKAAAMPIGATPAIADPGAVDARLAPSAPPDALRLEIFARRLERDGGAADAAWRADAMPAGIDHAWLAASEWRQLAAVVAPVGERRPFPPAIAAKFARCHLTDFTRGEAGEWEERDLHALDWSLVVEEETAGTRRLRIEGSARLGGRRRGYEPEIAGALTVTDGRITAFELVAIGDHWGIENDDAAPRARAPLGIAMRLAGDLAADAVPPHGMRDAGYLPASP